MAEKVTHEQINARIESVQRELTEAKQESKEHRDDLQKRLRAIEQRLAGLNGGWKVLVLLGAILAGTLAAIASVVAIMKGVE